MAQTVPLKDVPRDVSPRETKQVYNPLNIDFVHKFDGEEEVLISGEWNVFPAPMAVLLAKHLAKRIVLDISMNERESLLKKTSDKHYVDVAGTPYPRFNQRAGDVAKLLIADIKEKDPEIDPEEVLNKAKEQDQDKLKKKGEIMIPKGKALVKAKNDKKAPKNAPKTTNKGKKAPKNAPKTTNKGKKAPKKPTSNSSIAQAMAK